MMSDYEATVFAVSAGEMRAWATITRAPLERTMPPFIVGQQMPEIPTDNDAAHYSSLIREGLSTTAVEEV